MEKYFEINKNNQNIRCKLYYDKKHTIEKVVLFGHGFAGHKDNSAAQKFADRVLTKYKGIAVLIYNLPCHGDDVKKKMVLQDCMTYIETVIDYIRSELQPEEIYSYATSFGGYLVLKYISEHENPFAKIALRCPAVNMAEVLTKTIMKNDELELILKGKNTTRVEIEERLSQAEYLRLLMDADTSMHQIRKTRYCLTYKSQYFEIDIYPFWNDRAIVEIELLSEQEQIQIPKFIKIIKEVTDDKSYKNLSLASL